MTPIMPWEKFAEWIGMKHSLAEVKGWVETGEIPSIKIDGKVMVNLVNLLEKLRA